MQINNLRKVRLSTGIYSVYKQLHICTSLFHPVSSELENSGIRVAVGDRSVTERRRWRPPYQTGKTVHVHAKHYKHNEDGRTAPGVCGNGSVPLSHSGNVVTRIGIHTYQLISIYNSTKTKAGDRINKKFISKSFRRTMTY